MTSLRATCVVLSAFVVTCGVTHSSIVAAQDSAPQDGAPVLAELAQEIASRAKRGQEIVKRLSVIASDAARGAEERARAFALLGALGGSDGASYLVTHAGDRLVGPVVDGDLEMARTRAPMTAAVAAGWTCVPIALDRLTNSKLDTHEAATVGTLLVRICGRERAAALVRATQAAHPEAKFACESALQSIEAK